MYWNYRVIKQTFHYKDMPIDKEDTFTIHEVYYNKKHEITAVSVDAIAACGDKKKVLFKDLQMMQEAFLKPVLEYDKIKFHPNDSNEDMDKSLGDIKDE